MKRTFQEFSSGGQQQEAASAAEASQQQQNDNNEQRQEQNVLSLLYGIDAKRQKIEDQRIGDFIVKGLEAIHFKIVGDISEVQDEAKGKYFAPKYLYWLLGQEERIQGYKGLSVTICLSSKRLIPFLKVEYTHKAPPFAKIDDIEQLLTKHYGTIYTDLAKYQTEVLAVEQAGLTPPGSEFKAYESEDQVVYRVRLSDETFHSQNFYTQALLPFFIEGSVIVEPSPFWNYFMVYQKSTMKLMALFTVYEAHLSYDRYRTKVSQVLVLPQFQRRGIASRVYSLIYDYYRAIDTRCFQLMVEDAAEEFQKVQDVCHARIMLQHLADLSTQAEHPRPYHPVAAAILSAAQVKERQLDLAQIKHLSSLLKLPSRIILQINDLLIHSRLPVDQDTAQNRPIWNEFRFAIKQRFYVRCQHLFPGATKKLNPTAGTGLSGEAYIWNEILEDDQFARQIGGLGGQNGQQSNEEALQMLGGMAGKIQLNSMFDELVKMFNGIKSKIATLQ